ncbi:flagella synthesis protein FlgN [Gottschalkia acidurici 9a]|uniref:Flagella synthesis protein FlgN n=1 Tax=Gottschalkia acidurici (strain ATCC 7906 / DSM 604 / BCRC 14475 / CIP 104303 / KCTC 5404 / NCIMB 10678 / 9a) TaxID=1128398 RepID=K0AU24_GOTA9|nr:flagellar export chaperone FlgN [Gottschalkia acidurici]AFS77338.1 flagella synthesis protein FlgN [Gottschalkia acidurici 9a]
MEKNILNELMMLVDKKLNYLEEILSITSQQKQAITDEDVERLSSLLDKKDILIRNIDEIDSIYKEKSLNKLLEDDILTEKLKIIQALLNNIKLVDDENNKNLNRAIEDMGGKLKEVRQGQRAMKGYSNSDPYASFTAQGGTLFIDQDS